MSTSLPATAVWYNARSQEELALNRSLFSIVVVAALGGLLFGFDTGVISGCEQAIQDEFALSGLWQGLVISGALVGTVFGVFTAAGPSDRWGRKVALWLMGTLFLVSAVGCALTVGDKTIGPHMLGWMRFIGGLAIGGVSVVVPLYLAEISPGHLRGRLVATFQLNIVFGIVVSYVSNYLIARCATVSPSVLWRVMLGAECLPIILFMALLPIIPESPRWLVRVGRAKEAESVLVRIGDTSAAATVGAIRASLADAANGVRVALFQRRYLKPVALVLVYTFFNQTSGINAINYYAPRIFQMIFGEGSELAALAGTIGLGLDNLLFTTLAFFAIDRFGRRALLIAGSAAMVVMHSLVAWQISLGAEANPTLAVVGILGFMAAFASTSGAVIWVFTSEIFPNAVRAKGQALGAGSHWVMCAIVSGLFPFAVEKAGPWVFAFFAAMMLLQVFWAVFAMPETKGGSIEEMENRLGIGK